MPLEFLQQFLNKKAHEIQGGWNNLNQIQNGTKFGLFSEQISINKKFRSQIHQKSTKENIIHNTVAEESWKFGDANCGRKTTISLGLKKDL